MRLLVTGHLGFIGSHFVAYALAQSKDVQVIGFNRNSDQGNLRRLDMIPFLHRDRLKSVWGDLTDPAAMSGLCEGIDVVVHFAAKTFVDHAIRDPLPFLESNIIGSHNLMNEATRCKVKRYVQVSTDEVYGQILTGAYKEDATLNPRNPYSWTKAAADLDAIWRHRTYGFPCIITRTENNFGPWQHRQKALPTFTRCALNNEPLPVYGDGGHVRCWLHVNQHCAAIWHLIGYSEEFRPSHFGPHQHQTLGEVFHVAGEDELTNLDLAKLILRTLDKPEDMIRFIPDAQARPGHDRRYALDCSKLKATGFSIKQDLPKALAECVRWYADNEDWTR